ncbi:MAG: rRNA (cytidine-2'-O-)-methyltransferase, partial [Cyanobacteriota bacterium]
ALVSSGLPSGRFCFEGFLPPKAAARRQRVQALAHEERTLVRFEAPHRLLALLSDVLELLGDRPLRVARELTKRHEEQVGPSVAAVLEHFRHQPPQGECTLVLGGATRTEPRQWQDQELKEELRILIDDQGLGSREAARILAERTGIARRVLYALIHRED